MASKTSIIARSAKAAAAAESKPELALAYAFMAAFGFNLTDAVLVLMRILENEHWHMIALVMAASVQIRENVVFVGDNWKKLSTDYPEFVITGRAGSKDMFNFSALHLVGHVACNFARNSKLALLALKKGGDCVTGKYCGDNTAGKVNGEIAASWSREDKANVTDAAAAFDDKALCDHIEALAPMAKEFALMLA
jgi:hypothetical protein